MSDVGHTYVILFFDLKMIEYFNIFVTLLYAANAAIDPVSRKGFMERTVSHFLCTYCSV